MPITDTNGQNFQDIYGGSVDTKMVQVSGNSNHNQGLALVGYIEIWNVSMIRPIHLRW